MVITAISVVCDAAGPGQQDESRSDDRFSVGVFCADCDLVRRDRRLAAIASNCIMLLILLGCEREGLDAPGDTMEDVGCICRSCERRDRFGVVSAE